MSNFLLGGSAVWEGVMMFSPYGYAIACRRGDGVVVYREPFETHPSTPQMGFFSRLPFLRGTLAFILSLGMSMRAYLIANKLSSDEDISEPSFDGVFLLKILLNSLLGFVVLILVPDLLSRFLSHSLVIMTLWETSFRIILLVLYIFLFSLFPSGKRLLQYHGAEHKVINAYEEGAEMIPEEVEDYPRFHSRCGTTLFALVLLLLFLFYLPLQDFPILPRLTFKTLVLPFTLPVAFELVYLAWRDRRFSFLLLPGLWLQRITTKSPDREQLEVAITALREVVPIA